MTYKIKKMINNGTEYKIGSIDSSNETYNNIVYLSQEDYESLENPDENTMYSTPEDESGGGGGAGFKNISDCVYRGGLLVSFVADGESYTLTYQRGRLKTIVTGDKTYTITYAGGKLVGSVES